MLRTPGRGRARPAVVSSRAAGTLLALSLGGVVHAAPLFSESFGDFADAPNTSDPTPAIAPGLTWLAQGIVGSSTTDIDFLNFLVPFPCSMLVIDVDCNTPFQDSVLGVGNWGSLPTPGWSNDNDFNGADDTWGGHTLHPLDSALDVAPLFGGFVPGGTPLTIAIAEQGDQSIWDGTAGPAGKLEFTVWIYALPVPAPAAAGLLAVGGLAAARRRRYKVAVV